MFSPLFIYFKKIKFEYRKDPVPFTKKRKNYSYFRKMKTTNERRYASLHISEGYDKLIRRRRNHKNIIHEWEDVNRTILKNWKKFRKHQYKEKK